MESDKADMDVESYDDGYLAKIFTPEGGSAAVGCPVAVIVDTEAEIGTVGTGAGDCVLETKPFDQPAETEPASTGKYIHIYQHSKERKERATRSHSSHSLPLSFHNKHANTKSYSQTIK